MLLALSGVTGIGKGKKLYDKREDIAKKEAALRVRKQFGKIL